MKLTSENMPSKVDWRYLLKVLGLSIVIAFTLVGLSYGPYYTYTITLCLLLSIYLVHIALPTPSRPLGGLVFSWLGASLVAGLEFFFTLFFPDRLPVLGLGFMVSGSFALAYLWSEGDKEGKPRITFLILIGVSLFLSTAAQSHVNRFSFSFGEHIVFYALAGWFAARSVRNLLNASVIVIPELTLIPMIFLNEEIGNEERLVFVIQPIGIVLSFFLGYFLNQGSRWIRFGTLSVLGAMVFFYFTEVDGFLFRGNLMAMNTTLPDFELIDKNGKSIQSADFHEKVVWLTFYSTTCSSCLDELSASSAVSARFGSEPDLRMLAVCVPLSKRGGYHAYQRKEVFHSFGIQTAYDTTGSLSGIFAPSGVPEAYLVDKKGVIRWKKTGFYESDSLQFVNWLNSEIKSLL